MTTPRKPPAKKAPAKRPARKATDKTPAGTTRALTVVGSETVVFEPAAEAYQLHLTGVAWPEVAAKTGYADGRAANVAVVRYLQKGIAERSDEQRQAAVQLELDRLDALQQPYWSPALHGDLDAANFVLKVIAQRGKFLKIGETEEKDTAPRTLIISGDSANYVAKLKQMIEAPANPE